MYKKLLVKSLLVSVWAVSSVCFGTLSGGGMPQVHAMNIDQKNIEVNLQCCENRDETHSEAVYLPQIQPLLIIGPIVKQSWYDTNDFKIFKTSFRVLNTSSPPRNLPGVIVKKE